MSLQTVISNILSFSLVTAVDGIKFTDLYLQEQLDKVLQRTLNNRKPSPDASSDFVQILFKSNNSLPSSKTEATTTTTYADASNVLNVSYCYPTKEWRCLYRCEIDSSLLDSDAPKIYLTLFGSVNNPTEEDWSEVELILVANELEILNNNKPAPATVLSHQEAVTNTTRSSGSMQIFIKTLTGKTITIDVCIKNISFMTYLAFSNNRLTQQRQ